MGFTYGQLLAQQRQHFTKITHILEGKAFASTWAHSGQVVRYLFAKLKETENRESLVIAPEAWGLHAGEAVQNVVDGEDFPRDTFIDFLRNIDQEKFLLPIMLRNNHFAGLCINKIAANEGSSNAAIMLELKYVDPKGSAIEPENSNKDLAEIKVKLAEILQECCDANPELRDKHYQIGSEYNFSCEQQITDCDCAYITAQNLLDFAAGRSEFTCPNYQADPELAIAEIARLRREFVDPEIMGEEVVAGYLVQEMLDMLKDQRYDKVSEYIKTTSLEQFYKAGYGDHAEIPQIKLFLEEQVNGQNLRDYFRTNKHKCMKFLSQLEAELGIPYMLEDYSAKEVGSSPENVYSYPSISKELDEMMVEIPLRKGPLDEVMSKEDKAQKQKAKMLENYKEDVNRLIEIKQAAIKLVENPQSPDGYLEIGELCQEITWNQEDPNNIRNKHGYRNRSKDGSNKINAKGGKINFEVLTRLQDVPTKLQDISEKEKFLLTDVEPEVIIKSLKKLITKIEIAYSYELKTLKDHSKDQLAAEKILFLEDALISSQFENIDLKDEELGPHDDYLVIVSAYHHDLKCINRIRELVDELKNEYVDIDLTDKINRYALGRIFTEMGELAKEVSDFISVPRKGDEYYLTGQLFKTLGNYRQNVKNDPYIIISKNFLNLFQMQYFLLEESENIINYLNFLGTKINSLKNSEEIYQKYSTLNKPDPTEQSHYSQIEKETEINLPVTVKHLKNGKTIYKDLNKPKKETQEKLSEGKEEIKKLLEDLDQIKQAQEKQKAYSSNIGSSEHKVDVTNEVSALKRHETQFLIKTFGEENLSEIAFLNEEDISLERLNAIIYPKHINPGKHFEFIEKNILKYNKEIINILNKLREEGVNLIEGKLNQENFADWREKLFNYGVDYSKQIKEMEGKLKNLSKEQKQLTDKLQHIEFIEEFIIPQAKENYQRWKDGSFEEYLDNKFPLELSKNEFLLKNMIDESNFLIELLQELEFYAARGDKKVVEKLKLAEKTSFGFLGQYYKDFLEGDEFQKYIYENSILVQDFGKVMLVRHKEICHNILSEKKSDLEKNIQEEIKPWVEELKFMFLLFTNNLKFLLYNELFTLPALRYVSILPSNENDLIIYLNYLKMVSLNRFLKSGEALELYNNIFEGVTNCNATNSELYCEICWEASLAYRNLDDFPQAIEMLKKAEKYAFIIEDNFLRSQKLASVYADLGIALSQIDCFVEAREYLEKITIGDIKEFCLDIHIIIANILLTHVDVLENNDPISLRKINLIFIKYFDIVQEQDPKLAFLLIHNLVESHWKNYNMCFFHDLMIFNYNIYEKNRKDVKIADGQQSVYAISGNIRMFDQYELLKLIVYKKSSLFCQDFIKDMHELFAKVETQMGSITSIPYLNKRKLENELWIKIGILIDNPDVKSYIIKLSKDLQEDWDKLIKQFKDTFNEKIISIKCEMLKYFRNIDFPKNNKLLMHYSEVIFKLQQDFISSQVAFAYRLYILNDTESAKNIIIKSLMSRFLVHYFESKLLANINQLVDSQWCNNWLKELIDFDEIQEFAKEVLSAENITYTLSHNYNIIKDYCISKDNPKKRKDLIDFYEKELFLYSSIISSNAGLWLKALPNSGLFITRYLDVNYNVQEEKKCINITDRIESLIKDGNICFKKNYFQDAIECYNEALKYAIQDLIKYKYTSILYNKARAYQENGDIKQAISDFRELLNIDPNHQKAQNQFSVLLSAQGKNCYQEGNYEEALNKFTEAQKLIEKFSPQFLIKILFMKAQAEQQLNMYESALEDYIQIYKISPDEFHDLDLALLGE